MTLTLKPIKRAIRENEVEQTLCNSIHRLGGTAYKFVTPGRRSAPDRLCALPGGLIIFIECKRPGKEPTKVQYLELDRLHDLGNIVGWVSTKAEVHNLITRIKTRGHRGGGKGQWITRR